MFIKEVDFDSQQSIIDFSLYLRSTAKTSLEIDSDDTASEELNSEQMTVMLDQKNYIEELNRHLK